MRFRTVNCRLLPTDVRGVFGRLVHGRAGSLLARLHSEWCKRSSTRGDHVELGLVGVVGDCGQRVRRGVTAVSKEAKQLKFPLSVRRSINGVIKCSGRIVQVAKDLVCWLAMCTLETARFVHRTKHHDLHNISIRVSNCYCND